jgi:hypothetical protein
MRSTTRPPVPAGTTAYTFRPTSALSAMARNGDAAAKAEIDRRRAAAKARRILEV